MRITTRTYLQIITTAAIAVFINACGDTVMEENINSDENIDTMLCVGDYQTPEQAEKQLSKFASTYGNVKEWEERAKIVRAGFIEGAKLGQIPDSFRKAAFNPIIGKTHKMNGYTVSNIAIVGMPGHYITGNLYKPEDIKGKVPIVLCAHGHGFSPDDYGRFRPAEQKRAAALAKMGAVAFAYDMIGFGENSSFKHTEPNALQIQTFNSMRLLDYLCSLDYTDSTKIGITGSSGGGTQSLYLSVVDKRVSVIVPVVMTSSYFFGGCICESGMPVHKSQTHETNNVDLAALFAPKPALFISDGHDWTAHFPEIGFPYLKNVYKLYHADENVENVHLPDEYHDYGISKRKAAYKFLAKHLGLDYTAILDENGEVNEDFIRLIHTQDLKVFPDKPIVFMSGWSYEWSDVYVQKIEALKERGSKIDK